MEESPRKIFSVSESEAGDEVEDNEDLYDTCRAYGLLLHASGVIQSPEHEDASQEVYINIPPHYQYHDNSFLLTSSSYVAHCCIGMCYSTISCSI